MGATAFIGSHGNQTRSGFIAGVNVVLYLLFTITVIASGHNVRLFSYPWTYRKFGGYGDRKLYDNGPKPEDKKYGAADQIKWLFNEQKTITPASMLLLRDNIYETANCTEVYYAGAYWSPETVSPFCHCVSNLWVEFNRSMNTHDRVSDSDNLLQVRMAEVRKHMDDVCTKLSRPTMLEGMTSESSTSSTNIVVSTVLWNMISLVSSLFSVYFAVCKNPALSLRAEAAFVGAGVVCLGLWFWVLAAVRFTDWGNLLLSLAYAAFFGSSLFFWFMVRKSKEENFTVRNSIVHWLGYAINLSLVFTSFNSLMQRRDAMYQEMMICVALVMGCLGLAGDYLSYFKAYMYTVGMGPGEKWSVLWETKHIHRYFWIANMVFAIGVFNVAGPTFTAAQFSNTHNSLWFVLPLLMLPLVLQPNGLKAPEDHSKAPLHMYLNEHVGTMATREMFDLAARLIFTLALIGDLHGVGQDDNVLIYTKVLVGDGEM